MGARRTRGRRALAYPLILLPVLALLSGCLSSDPLEGLDGARSRAFAVNENGVIVGRAVAGDGHQVGVMWDGAGVMTELPRLNGGTAEALDVNDQGQIVGHAFHDTFDCIQLFCPFNRHHAFLYDSTTGTLQDLADFGVGDLPPDASQQIATGSVAEAINEAGIVVGTSASIGPPTEPGVPFTPYSRGFALDTTTGVLTDLSAYGLTSAHDINEHGHVIGQLVNPQLGQAAVLDLATGAVTPIGTFGGSFSRAHAINDEGLVVGNAQVADNSAFHAFVFDLATGVLTDIGTLQAPGAPNSTAYGVSNDGIVVGTSAASGEQHPFAYDVSARSIHDLGVLGGSNIVEARDINDAGVVVGFSGVDPRQAWRTSVWRHY